MATKQKSIFARAVDSAKGIFGFGQGSTTRVEPTIRTRVPHPKEQYKLEDFEKALNEHYRHNGKALYKSSEIKERLANKAEEPKASAPRSDDKALYHKADLDKRLKEAQAQIKETHKNVAANPFGGAKAAAKEAVATTRQVSQSQSSAPSFSS